MKKVFVIDWILVFAFILSVCSGIGLYVVGHENDHVVWHDWAVFHVLTSFCFLSVTVFHLAAHRGWYKGVVKKGIGRKSKTTGVLSILFLFVSVTGIVLLGVDGANSEIGLWHYKIGIVMSLLSAGHIFKRLPVLRRSVSGGRQ